MDNPLTKEQEALRGKNIKNFSTSQLKEWIEACNLMEPWVKTNKARRSWKHSREKAKNELNKRLSRKRKTIQDLLCEEQIRYEIENEKGTFDLWDKWRSRFKANGLTRRDCQWHVFSFNTYENYLEMEEAEDRYKKLLVNEYLIIIHGEPAVRCFSSKLPDLEKLKEFTRNFNVVFDLYVCHKNFKWTFVITHEDMFGPYFAE